LVVSTVLSEVPSFPLLSSFMLHYNLHYKLFAPTPARGENGPELLGAGGSDPDKLFGRIDCQKVGSLPPVSVFFPR